MDDDNAKGGLRPVPEEPCGRKSCTTLGSRLAINAAQGSTSSAVSLDATSTAVSLVFPPKA